MWTKKQWLAHIRKRYEICWSTNASKRNYVIAFQTYVVIIAFCLRHMNIWTQLNIWPNRINNCRLSIALLQLKWPKWPHLCRYIRSSQYSSYTHSHSLTQSLPNPTYIHSHFISNWRKCAAKCNTHIFWIPLNPQNNSKERNDMIQQKMLLVLYWFLVSFIAIYWDQLRVYI